MYSQRMEEAVASIEEAGAHLKNSVSSVSVDTQEFKRLSHRNISLESR